jgi:hypothetical protein
MRKITSSPRTTLTRLLPAEQGSRVAVTESPTSREHDPAVHHVVAVLVVAAVALSVAGGAAAAPSPERPTVVIEADRAGFHWLDAGIGAAAALALVVLAYGLVLLRRTAIRPANRSLKE